ncbi:MAG TPA: hypothetical protein VJ417_01325, partial [Candidatus Glassbacteria bacterium]|nr:hypothetical protein [Candidatus Glassbacteria bacterium]
MEISDLSTQDITETVRHNLDELGVRDAGGLESLFSRLEAQLREDVAQVRQGTQAQPEKLEALRVRWLGRKQGIISLLTDNWLRPASPELKREIGQRLNALREKVTAAESAVSSLTATEDVAVEKGLDITLPGNRRTLGAQHPVRRAIDEIVEIFNSLGYSVEEGPDIESVYYNFEALNIPEDHPA